MAPRRALLLAFLGALGAAGCASEQLSAAPPASPAAPPSPVSPSSSAAEPKALPSADRARGADKDEGAQGALSFAPSPLAGPAPSSAERAPAELVTEESDAEEPSVDDLSGAATAALAPDTALLAAEPEGEAPEEGALAGDSFGALGASGLGAGSGAGGGGVGLRRGGEARGRAQEPTARRSSPQRESKSAQRAPAVKRASSDALGGKGFIGSYSGGGGLVGAQQPYYDARWIYRSRRLYGPMLSPATSPLSTFAIDVDTASYTRLRAALRPRVSWSDRSLIQSSVRVEELINSFPYQLLPPKEGAPHPFSVSTELSTSPWGAATPDSPRLLLRVALKAAELPAAALPPSHLVFLVDVSGSMGSSDKLPLVKRALLALVKTLRPEDSVSLVTYSGEVKTLLPPTSGAARRKISAAISRLKARGQTAGGAGLARAYELARAGWVEGGNNRVVVTTDGDFNVGISSVYEIKEMISSQRKSGVFLSVLGFGVKNYSDANMSALAEAGNGNYAFIDSDEEAARALVRERAGTLVTVARDMKVQVEFNPARVKEYRLIGYKSRALAARSFNDDRVDGGELGAGQSVTVLYELIPTPAPEEESPPLDAPRYGARAPEGASAEEPARLKVARDEEPTPSTAPSPALNPALAAEWLTVKVRYQPPSAPAGAESRRALYPVTGEARDLYSSSLNHRAAVSLALLSERARGVALSNAASQLNALAAPRPEDLAPPATVARLKELRQLSALLDRR